MNTACRLRSVRLEHHITEQLGVTEAHEGLSAKAVRLVIAVRLEPGQHAVVVAEWNRIFDPVTEVAPIRRNFGIVAPFEPADNDVIRVGPPGQAAPVDPRGWRGSNPKSPAGAG